MELKEFQVKKLLDENKNLNDKFAEKDVRYYRLAEFCEKMKAEYEQKIKELTEENEKLLNELEGAPLMPSEYEVLYKGKCEENKELARKLECANLEIECKERICESYMLQYGTVAHKEVWLKKEREATIQKYREALYRAFAHFDSNDKFNKKVFLEVVDQIKKEMIEGEKK